jgi:hypothetical protein
MGKIIRFVGVTPQQNGSYRSRIEPRPPKLLTQAVRTYRRISGRLMPFLKYHDYDVEPAFLKKS